MNRKLASLAVFSAGRAPVSLLDSNGNLRRRRSVRRIAGPSAGENPVNRRFIERGLRAGTEQPRWLFIVGA